MNQSFDPLDITGVDLHMTAETVRVAMRVLDLTPNYWDVFQVAVEIDGQREYAVSVYPDQHPKLVERDSWMDSGTVQSCSGIVSSVDYDDSEMTVSVPTVCLGSISSLAVQTQLFNAFPSGSSCCPDTATDLFPDDPGKFSARVFPAASTYDADGPQGTIYRLYRAYFLREPDRSGFEYWYGVYQNGYPLDKISNDFARSVEFQSQYGSVDNRRFLELVYQNVLGRTPDQGGYDYWLDQMNHGMLRGFVMIYFSESDEFRMKTSNGVPPGYQMDSDAIIASHAERDVQALDAHWRALSDAFALSSGDGWSFVREHNYPGMGTDPSSCGPEGHWESAELRDGTVRTDYGWTVPEGPIKAEQIKGRLYVMDIRETIGDAQSATTKVVKAHLTVLPDGSVKHFYACW